MKSILRMTGMLFVLLVTLSAAAKEGGKKSRLGFVGNGNLYFSWGYNKEWYTRSTVHVSQPSLNSEYQLRNVRAHDRPGWDDDFFHTALTVPQYNYRLGYFFNQKQDFGIEINFDHTKYVIADGQTARIAGTVNGETTDKQITYSGEQGFYYYLNNGANFLLFNLVKRCNLYQSPGRMLRIDLLAKAGIGPVIPHVENSFFYQKNDPGFQFGGWNTGVETALRVSVLKYVYLDFAQKADYARYSNLHIYEGTARQSFGTYELILSLGVNIPVGKNSLLFKRQTNADAGL
ncbi:MAG: hypothetical protein QM642_07445 [Edaphocola sp.]